MTTGETPGSEVGRSPSLVLSPPTVVLSLTVGEVVPEEVSGPHPSPLRDEGHFPVILGSERSMDEGWWSVSFESGHPCKTVTIVFDT